MHSVHDLWIISWMFSGTYILLYCRPKTIMKLTFNEMPSKLFKNMTDFNLMK